MFFCPFNANRYNILMVRLVRLSFLPRLLPLPLLYFNCRVLLLEVRSRTTTVGGRKLSSPRTRCEVRKRVRLVRYDTIRY